jgi:peptide chain release factor 2
MKLLVSRLTHLLESQHKEKIEELKGEAAPIEWGRQIRSYVLQPYKLVKDHRTEYETSNADAVLAGELDDLIEEEIRKLAERKNHA